MPISGKPIDVYVRVSSTGGREGDSFQSPTRQADRCRAQLQADGLEVGEVFTDLDQSGGTMRRPQFDKVMERMRAGTSGGVIVADLSRLGRSTRGVLDAVTEVTEAGAQVISCSEKLDTSSAMGRFVLTVLAALREMELDRFREQFDSATQTFLARGGHGGSFIPPGYDRDTTPGHTGRLIPNEDAAAIHGAFRMRSEGKTLREIADTLKEAGVLLNRPVKPQSKRKRPAVPHADWNESAVGQMLSNDVYLGIASARSTKREGAHQPLVTRREFDAAQAKRSAGRVQDGERTEGALLTGLLRCSSCGGVLTNDGKRYRCNSRGRGVQPCTKRVIINRDVVEPYVEAKALGYLGAMDFDSSSRTAGPSAARLGQAVADAEAEVAAYLLHVPATTLGFADGLAQREATVIEARSALDRASGTDEAWTYLTAGATAETYARMTLADKRKVISACLVRAIVEPGGGGAEKRITVDYADHPLAKVKRPSTPIPPRPTRKQ
jgi:DNA invertase Pin-like site-specific DNA recombinase